MGRGEVTTAPLLDTHVWVWWLRHDERLRRRSIAQLDALPSSDRPSVADISLWEVAMLVSRQRLTLDRPLEDWLAVAAHPRTVHVVPISSAIAAETARLPRALRDPADRIIVATSRVAEIPLFTRDAAILRSRLAARWTPA